MVSMANTRSCDKTLLRRQISTNSLVGLPRLVGVRHRLLLQTLFKVVGVLLSLYAKMALELLVFSPGMGGEGRGRTIIVLYTT